MIDFPPKEVTEDCSLLKMYPFYLQHLIWSPLDLFWYHHFAFLFPFSLAVWQQNPKKTNTGVRTNWNKIAANADSYRAGKARCHPSLRVGAGEMFRKVYIYAKTHPLTRPQKYPPSHKCHINSPQISSKKYAEKSRKHLVRRDMTLSLRSTKRIVCGAGLRRLCEASALKWLFKTCSQPFPQKPVLNRSLLFPPQYGRINFFFKNPAFERKSVLSLVLPWIKKPTNPMISSMCRFLQQTKKKPKKNWMAGVPFDTNTIRSGVYRPPSYCAPLVCVPVVIRVLAVWRHNKPKAKNQPSGGNLYLPCLCCELLSLQTWGNQQRSKELPRIFGPELIPN